jgi:cytochrome oxidase Cu insertion factor (SCO1/SenC/PrrC family)
VVPARLSSAPRETRRRLLHDPYLWAALAGLVLIPALRPFLRFDPAPPPLYGSLPDLRLVDQEARSFALAGGDGGPRPGSSVRVVGFFSTRCGAPCEPVLSGLAQLAARYRAEEIGGIEVLAITVDPDTDSPDVLGAFADRRDLSHDAPRLLTGEPTAIRLLLAGFRAGDPRTQLHEAAADVSGDRGDEHGAPLADDRLVIVDRTGGLRGSYSVDAAGLDEVFHRSRHVLEERRPPRPARLAPRR